MLLDKTGALTTGTMSLHEITVLPGADEKQVLRLAGAVEDASEHPAGQAIARAAAARLGGLPPAEAFTAVPGAGVQGSVGGHAVVLRNPRFLAGLGMAAPLAC